jgi:heme/copper-type cytochrome/quinol oxidase subunit 2
MTGEAIAMMIVICSLVWGGFITFLCFVWRIERRKSARNGPGSEHGS